MDFVFCFSGNLELKLVNGSHLKIENAQFIGNFEKAYQMKFSSGISILHVRFKPKGIYPITKIPLINGVNSNVPIEELLSKSALNLYQQMGEKSEPLLKINLLEKYLIKLYIDSTLNYRFNQGIDIIQSKKGMVNIRELSSELNLSYKSLERWFKSNIGLTPKKFCDITRFKNIIEEIDSRKCSDWMHYVTAYNFYDQSHFIRNFEEFSGLTPHRYLEQHHIKTSV